MAQVACSRRREYLRELDEGATPEGFTLGDIKAVRGCELDPQLLIAGGVNVGEARTGHQRSRGFGVLGERDVPVPPVLVVASPVLIDAAVLTGALHLSIRGYY